jgi:cobalamin biosynthesis protein CobD/CbiB
MTCPHCNEAISPTDYNCPTCGKLVARTREELNRIDVRTSKGIAWALVGMGLAGYVFVIINSQTDWFSALDFVAPTAVLLAGLGGLLWVKRKG